MKPYPHTITDCVLDNQIGGFVGENDTIPSNIIKCNCNKKNQYHPTEKPLELMEQLIKLFSISKNHVILDPFTGSGTTGVACNDLNRKFIGIEINQNFCKIAEQRITSKPLV